jgi:hypothetical protein
MSIIAFELLLSLPEEDVQLLESVSDVADIVGHSSVAIAAKQDRRCF